MFSRKAAAASVTSTVVLPSTGTVRQVCFINRWFDMSGIPLAFG